MSIKKTKNVQTIVAVNIPSLKKHFILRRYNGCNHEHTNKIEAETITGFHIHIATERYQKYKQKAEGYAQKTDRYNNVNGALQCLLEDANFEEPPTLQINLLEEP